MWSSALCKSASAGWSGPEGQKPAYGAHSAIDGHLLAALASRPPRPLPVWSDACDVDACAEHLCEVLGATFSYLRRVLDHVVQNTPSDVDVRQIEALCCDLLSEVKGAVRSAAAALPGGRS